MTNEGSASNVTTKITKTIETVVDRSSDMISSAMEAKKQTTSLLHHSPTNTNITIANDDSTTLQAQVVEAPTENETEITPSTTTTTEEPTVEEDDADTPAVVENEINFETDSEIETKTSPEPSERVEAPSIAEANTTMAPAIATELESTAIPQAAATEPPIRPIIKSPVEAAEDPVTVIPTTKPSMEVDTTMETTTAIPTRSQTSVVPRASETTALPKAGETTAMPVTGETKKTISKAVGGVTTKESDDNKYTINIPLEKKINKRTRRKLWAEIEKRKPFLPQHVRLHIQKYARPPFETWGCRFRYRNPCFSCS